MSTQVEDIFNPKRADPKDPQYEGIHRQEFNCLNPQENYPTVTEPIQFREERKVEVIREPEVHITQDEEKVISRPLDLPKKSEKKEEKVSEPKPKLKPEPKLKPVPVPDPIPEPESMPRIKEIFVAPGAVIKMGE